MRKITKYVLKSDCCSLREGNENGGGMPLFLCPFYGIGYVGIIGVMKAEMKAPFSIGLTLYWNAWNFEYLLEMSIFWKNSRRVYDNIIFVNSL